MKREGKNPYWSKKVRISALRSRFPTGSSPAPRLPQQGRSAVKCSQTIGRCSAPRRTLRAGHSEQDTWHNAKAPPGAGDKAGFCTQGASRRMCPAACRRGKISPAQTREEKAGKSPRRL